MNERIDIPEGEDKALYSQRFRETAKRYKITGWVIALSDIILIILIMGSYISGKSSRMDLTITVAILCVLTFPFIFSAFNKGSQLISDIESDRVQVVTGNVTKIKKEKKRGTTVRVINLDRAKININEKYCDDFSVNDRIQVIRGISSRIAIKASLDTGSSS